MNYLVKHSLGSNTISTVENLRIYLSRMYEPVEIYDADTEVHIGSWVRGQKAFELAPGLNLGDQPSDEALPIFTTLTLEQKPKSKPLPAINFAGAANKFFHWISSVLLEKQATVSRATSWPVKSPGSGGKISRLSKLSIPKVPRSFQKKVKAKAEAEAKRQKANEASRRSKAKARNKVNG